MGDDKEEGWQRSSHVLLWPSYFSNFKHGCNMAFFSCFKCSLTSWNIYIVLAYRVTQEKPGWCSDPHLPPCAAYALSFTLDISLCNLSFMSMELTNNNVISSVILDLWKLWPLLFLGKHGDVCGIWFRYLPRDGYCNITEWVAKLSFVWYIQTF